jgi:hypothetical protein
LASFHAKSLTAFKSSISESTRMQSGRRQSSAVSSANPASVVLQRPIAFQAAIACAGKTWAN